MLGGTDRNVRSPLGETDRNVRSPLGGGFASFFVRGRFEDIQQGAELLTEDADEARHGRNEGAEQDRAHLVARGELGECLHVSGEQGLAVEAGALDGGFVL